MPDSSKILLTRSHVQSLLYAEELQNEGFEVVISPMISIQPVMFELPDLSQFQALVFTSMNGIDAFVQQAGVLDLPVYIVGSASADYARSKGFEVVCVAGKNAAGLKAFLSHELEPVQGALLYVRAQDVAYNLQEELEKAGFTVENLIAYKAILQDDFSEDAIVVFKQKAVSVIPFFSKRTAENFVTLIQRNNMENMLGDTKALCISAGVLGCVQSLPWAGTFVAKTPDKEAVTHLVREHVR